MYNRKHGPCWPASPLGHARPSAIRRCSLPPPAPYLPFPPPNLPTLPCSTKSTRAAKYSASAVYMYACCMCVRGCVSLWIYNIPCLYYSSSFPAGMTVSDPTVLAPPSLHVSWRSNGASLPCCVCVPPCSSPVPAPSCMMLLFFQVPQAAESSPPVGVGSWLPRHGELGPRWFPAGGSPFPTPPLFIPRPATTAHCQPCG